MNRWLYMIMLVGATGFAADSVRMTSGGTLEGQVIRDTPRDPLVVVNTGGKLLFLNRDDISAINLDEDGRAEYRRRAGDIKEGADAKTRAKHLSEAHFQLYTWCKAQGLYDYADQELMAALSADGTHAEARKALAETKKPLAEAKPQISATAPNTADPDPADFVIAPRHEIHAARPGQGPSSPADILSRARILSDVRASDEERKAAQKALAAEPLRSREVFLTSLDAAKVSDPELRLAALNGIEAANPPGTEVSNALIRSTIDDPDKGIRKRAAQVIKARHDDYALDEMVQKFIASFDDAGNIRDSFAENALGNALHEINDNRVYNAMMYYATMEIRTAVSDLNSFKTRQIDSYTVNQGAQAAVVIPLSFPIQFPELKIMSVKTTVKAPCAALSSFSGQNFGNDLDAWAKWIRQQK